MAGALVISAGVLAACGGSSSDSSLIRVNGSEPETGLITTTTNENGGGRIVDRLFTGLYYYDADGNPKPAMVDKLDTTDNKNYTITIKKGWKFTDGTEVKAHNFVDAWNFGAYTPNAQKQQSFFAPIAGYDEVSSENPTVKTMSGLKVVDDYTFTVALKQPAIDFKLGLGFTPFKPLPDVAFKDIKAFGENPVGNGPYKLQTWQHNVKADIVPNPDYPGENKAQNKGISFVFYTSLDTGYADLQSGNLDVLDTIPTSALRTYKQDLGDRAIDKATAQNQTITIPERLAHFGGQEGVLRRQAISMAIDRKQITTNIFQGSRNPSKDFTASSLPGFDGNLPGESNLEYNPTKAVALWNQANAISPWSGKFVISTNYDGGHKEWTDAAANSIKNTLKIDAEGAGIPTFSQLRQQINDKTIQTAFRAGWQGDYPSMLEFLEPIFVTGGGSNDAGYSNPTFDAKVREAESQTSAEASYKVVGEAQQILLNDLPAIPMWDYVNNAGVNTGVKASITWSGLPDYENITK
ncbi:ABC transporter substrate-binding protein [Williamsia maris]